MRTASCRSCCLARSIGSADERLLPRRARVACALIDLRQPAALPSLNEVTAVFRWACSSREAGSWPARLRRACAAWADATDRPDAASETPARLKAAGARPRYLATRRTAHALDGQPLRAGDQARIERRTIRQRLRSNAPRHEQHQRQNDHAPAKDGEPPYLAKRAPHLLAGTGAVITRSI
jgi:hypothetical protein